LDTKHLLRKLRIGMKKAENFSRIILISLFIIYHNLATNLYGGRRGDYDPPHPL